MARKSSADKKSSLPEPLPPPDLEELLEAARRGCPQVAIDSAPFQPWYEKYVYDTLYTEHQPRGFTECSLVREMAHARMEIMKTNSIAVGVSRLIRRQEQHKEAPPEAIEITISRHVERHAMEAALAFRDHYEERTRIQRTYSHWHRIYMQNSAELRRHRKERNAPPRCMDTPCPVPEPPPSDDIEIWSGENGNEPELSLPTPLKPRSLAPRKALPDPPASVACRKRTEVTLSREPQRASALPALLTTLAVISALSSMPLFAFRLLQYAFGQIGRLLLNAALANCGRPIPKAALSAHRVSPIFNSTPRVVTARCNIRRSRQSNPQRLCPEKFCREDRIRRAPPGMAWV